MDLQPRLYTIPPNVAFMPALASAILAGGFPNDGQPPPEPLDLADWTVYVPTRRSARGLTAAFLETGDRSARLLPQIKPLGDIEPDFLDGEPFETGSWQEPAAISGLARQFILANLIETWAQRHPENELARSAAAGRLNALYLADSLARLIDRFDNDNVPLTALLDIADDDLAMHHLDAQEFLKIVTQVYPELLSARGEVSALEYRSRALLHKAERLKQNPPLAPVIAAGSTGTIRATAMLLSTIAELANGAVVLPGLDRDMDEDSWAAIDARHPQYGLKKLLQHIGCGRHDVALLPGLAQQPRGEARCWLLSETMRPSETTDQWRNVLIGREEKLAAACSGLTIIEAPDQTNEAAAIALIMRQALEQQGLTAALITPDRYLARQVKAELRRWKIDIDDSAGDPLLQAPAAVLMLLLINAAQARFTHQDLVALFNHPLFCCGLERQHLLRLARRLELAVLRRSRRLVSLQEFPETVRYFAHLEDPHALRMVKELQPEDWAELEEFAGRLRDHLIPLSEALTNPSSFPALLSTHIKVLETCASGPDQSSQTLWQGEAGKALSETLAGLIAEGDNCPPLNGQDYSAFLYQQFMRKAVRNRVPHEQRLAIYGLLEARLTHSDIVILGGLNEDIWPPRSENDPWLNRPQKKQLELQLPEQRIGLSAHDFVQAAAAEKVYLTYSDKIRSDPALPSRWLQRLSALLNSTDLHHLVAPEHDWIGWSLGLAQPQNYQPVPPAKPSPRVDLRPRQFSVTQIDRLLRDPYEIFARKILKLEELEPLDPGFSARERGIAVHAGLNRFLRGQPDFNAKLDVEQLIALIGEETAALPGGEENLLEWAPRLQRLAAWFVDYETAARANLARQWTEVSGEIDITLPGGVYKLRAKADRIDLDKDNTLTLIDYKTTSGKHSFKETAKEFSCQLLLEAVIAKQGGFEGVPEAAVAAMVFLYLTGGSEADEEKALRENSQARVEDTFAAFCGLLRAYEDPLQPYLPLNWTRNDRRELPFDHLNRWREWGHVPVEADGQ